MNKDKGLPDGNEPNKIVEQVFPTPSPIFWGPNQNTVFDGTYVEPKDWHKNEIMKIPQVARFIVGGGSTELRRMFPIGYFNTVLTYWHVQNADINAYSPQITNGGERHRLVYDFIPTDPLPIGSNLTALECLNRFTLGNKRIYDFSGQTPLGSGTGNYPILSNRFFGYDFALAGSGLFPVSYPRYLADSGVTDGDPAFFTGSLLYGTDVRTNDNAPNVMFSLTAGVKQTIWVWVYHQIGGAMPSGATGEYGCIGLKLDPISNWDLPKINPGTASQEFSLFERNYILDLRIPR